MMGDVDGRRRDWSQLQPDLLELISGAFTEISDHFRLRSVCRSWRSANTYLPLSRASPWPWLLLLPKIGSEEDEDCHVIIPFDDWRRFTLRTPYSLRMKSCCVFGSPHGYFLVFDKTTGSVSITNPLASGSWFTLPIPVPTAGSGRRINQVKIFKSDDCKVAVVVSIINYTPFSEKTFLWRTGDSVWTQMYNVGNMTFDFVLYKGSFYFGGCGPGTTVLDSTTLVVTDEISHPHIEGWDDGFICYHLVESSCGELLMVAWNHHNGNYRMWVFRLDFSKRQPKWMRVRNIGDDTLFLNFHDLMCFPTGQLGLFKKNCMYFVNMDGKTTFMSIEDNKLEVLPHFVENHIQAWMIPSCSRASCTSDNGLENLRMMLDHETGKNRT